MAELFRKVFVTKSHEIQWVITQRQVRLNREKRKDFPKLQKAEKIANNLQCSSPGHLKLYQQKIPHG